MLTKVSKKIDKFYIFLIIAMVIMAALVIFTFRGLFSAMSIAYEIDIQPEESELKVNKENLIKAYDQVVKKEIVPLNTR